MSPLQLAHRYMDCFYGQMPLKDLRELLADNMVFDGPFLQCKTADEYMSALLADPPAMCNYQVLREYESGDTACLVYRFRKGAIEAVMVQIFETSGDRISGIQLVFDSNRFRQGEGD